MYELEPRIMVHQLERSLAMARYHRLAQLGWPPPATRPPWWRLLAARLRRPSTRRSEEAAATGDAYLGRRLVRDI